MRLHHRVPMLAAAVSAAAIAVPGTAQAKFDNTTYPPLGAPYVSHHTGGSSDWAVVGLAAGGIALIGAGTVTSRRVIRRGTRARVVSGS
jgi:hypothetical protein